MRTHEAFPVTHANGEARPADGIPASHSLLLDDIFQRACVLIDATYNDCQLNPPGLARQLRCSRASLYRAFQQHRLTVSGYIQRVRFEHVQASLALAPPRIPISSIAMDCGFECLRHFNRRFKQVFGDTPGAYRMALRRATAQEHRHASRACDPSLRIVLDMMGKRHTHR